MSEYTLADLKPDPRNARKHNPRNVGMIVDSLHQVGAARSIVIDEDNVILAGNGVIEAAAEAGIMNVRIIEASGNEIIAVKRSGLTPEQKTKLALFDNRTSELADWDIDVLGELDIDLGDLWFDSELAELGIGLDEPTEDPGAQADKAAELQEKWQTERGQVWEIGKHRLMCGDSTSAEEVGGLMGGEKAGLIMADPPYNVEYTGGSTNDTERSDSYADSMSDADYTNWLSTVLGVGYGASDSRSALLLWFASAKMRCVLDGLEGAGWTTRTLIVWSKLKAHYGALGAQYKHKFEPMWYCFKPKKAPRFYGATNETTVWEFEQPRVNELHPTMKPIALYERCVTNHLERGGIALELFLGSGTTMVAAEQTGRICYGMEIEPKYCAVTLERMAGMGLEPRLSDEMTKQ